jgi:hypothetical protein
MPTTCGLEDVSVYYFFSTCAQAIAATTSLSGAMLIFRYQALYQLVAEGAQGVATEFRRSPIARFVPWEGDDQTDFSHHTTFIGKTNVLRRYFCESTAIMRRKQFKANFESAKLDVSSHMQQYEVMRHLFAQYEARVHAARRLRRLTITTTCFGLLLVLTGSLLVLTPAAAQLLPSICSAWYFYVPALAAYMIFSVYVTAVAFTNPMRER